MKKMNPVPLSPLRPEISCIICDHKGARALYNYFYEGGNSEVLECSNCKHLFIQPVPLAELNKRTMDSVGDAEFFGSQFLKSLHENLVIKTEIRAVRKFLLNKTPRLLDIGCGTGWTSSVWRKNGFDVTGIEPSAARSKIARDVHHLKVSNDHLENFHTPELFDVIIMRHLLEHIEQPTKMLAKVKEFLKPDGILLIVIPNIACIGRYLFRGNWEWVLPWHLHFYTPKTLPALLEKTGYKKLKIYQTPSPLWYPHTLNKALFGENPKFQFPMILALLLSLPIVLVGTILNLNDNMTLIFRNKTQKPKANT